MGEGEVTTRVTLVQAESAKPTTVETKATGSLKTAPDSDDDSSDDGRGASRSGAAFGGSLQLDTAGLAQDSEDYVYRVCEGSR